MKDYCKNCGLEIHNDVGYSWKHYNGYLTCEAANSNGEIINPNGTVAEPPDKSTNFKNLYDKLSGTEIAKG